MTSVELGEQLETARKYCEERELSRFLRQLIEEYDERQSMIPVNHNNERKIMLSQTITFLTIGITFLIIAVSEITDIVFAVNSVFLVFCGFFLFIYVYFNLKVYRMKNGGV